MHRAVRLLILSTFQHAVYVGYKNMSQKNAVPQQAQQNKSGMDKECIGWDKLDFATICFEKDLFGKLLGVEQSLIGKLCASIKML